MVKSVYHTIKPNRLVELLKRMSTGPLSETKQGQGGNIEPVLHYYTQHDHNQNYKEANSKHIKGKEFMIIYIDIE